VTMGLQGEKGGERETAESGGVKGKRWSNCRRRRKGGSKAGCISKHQRACQNSRREKGARKQDARRGDGSRGGCHNPPLMIGEKKKKNQYRMTIEGGGRHLAKRSKIEKLKTQGPGVFLKGKKGEGEAVEKGLES